jgi:predicted lipoprotein with Yx(FWY)xxD motif
VLAGIVLVASGFSYFVVRDVSSIGGSHAIASANGVGGNDNNTLIPIDIPAGGKSVGSTSLPTRPGDRPGRGPIRLARPSVARGNIRIPLCEGEERFPVSITVRPFARSSGRWLLGGSLLLGTAVTVAACSSSSTSSPGAGSSPSSAPASSSAGASASAFTISAKSVPGVGTVLVNGQGRTLYLLSSEKGGKITCTDANGCTKYWPDTELPKGMTAAKAGSGIQASLLGTVKSADGNLYVTYNGWPLYTYIGDSGPGAANGEGIVSFGGTWDAVTTSGGPAMKQAASSPSSGGGGAGY